MEYSGIPVGRTATYRLIIILPRELLIDDVAFRFSGTIETSELPLRKSIRVKTDAFNGTALLAR
jgi:hypothetical protein